MAGLDWPLMSRGRNPVFALEMIQTDIDLETSLFEYNLSQSSIRPGDDSDRGLLRFRGGGGDNLSQSSIRPGDDSDIPDSRKNEPGIKKSQSSIRPGDDSDYNAFLKQIINML